MKHLVSAMLIAFTLAACGDEETTGPGQTLQPAVFSVVFTPASAALVSLGETVQLTANALDANGNTISGKTFTWSSSDQTIATVSSSGLVTAMANGSVTITAATDGVDGTAAIEVDQQAAQLAFAVEPTETIGTALIVPAVQVVIEDELGNLVANATSAVMVAIGTNPGGGVVVGLKTVSAAAGIASFGGLSINRVGTGYTLVATSANFSSATSAAFDILPFTVITADDMDDGTCDATHCSLREALNGANANPGTDMIEFNIPGVGPHTIQPLSALPWITDSAIIDGYTQSGASPNTNGPGLGSNAVLKIELDGSNAGVGASGLTIVGSGSTVKGLVINRFNAFGIWLNGTGGSVVRGNIVGTDMSGSIDLGNGSHGIFVNDESNVIGGTEFSARNVVSGNGGAGIRIEGILATGNRVFGNFIGTDLTGTLDVGNTGVGVRVNASNTTIGGTDPGARNLISGNDVSGVVIRANSSGTGVFGNFIGTDVTGMSALGNTFDGVHIRESFNNTIGGTDPGARNVLSGNGDDGIQLSVAATNNVVLGNFIGTAVKGTPGLGNGQHGVVIFGSNNTIGGSNAGARNVISGNGDAGIAIIVFTGSVNRNLVSGNSISSNARLGIDLGGAGGSNPSGDGVTPNDAGDGDTGANHLQNFPVLTSAVTGGNSIMIGGDLNSTAATEFRLELFANAACDPSGNGEGETFLGSTMVTTDGSGNAGFTVTLTATVAVGQFITATATDPNNNTSEFSQCTAVA